MSTTQNNDLDLNLDTLLQQAAADELARRACRNLANRIKVQYKRSVRGTWHGAAQAAS